MLGRRPLQGCECIQITHSVTALIVPQRVASSMYGVVQVLGKCRDHALVVVGCRDGFFKRDISKEGERYC